MKKLLFLFLLAGTFCVQAQNAKEWLSLTPIPVKKPTFNKKKNVKDSLCVRILIKIPSYTYRIP